MPDGTRDDPWVLKTAPCTSEYKMFRDPEADPPALVCVVGSTTLKYHISAVENLHATLAAQGGGNPVGSWYGLRKGYRGRFGMYLPPLLEHLGLVELEHNPRNNRVSAR